MQDLQSRRGIVFFGFYLKFCVPIGAARLRFLQRGAPDSDDIAWVIEVDAGLKRLTEFYFKTGLGKDRRDLWSPSVEHSGIGHEVVT